MLKSDRQFHGPPNQDSSLQRCLKCFRNESQISFESLTAYDELPCPGRCCGGRVHMGRWTSFAGLPIVTLLLLQQLCFVRGGEDNLSSIDQPSIMANSSLMFHAYFMQATQGGTVTARKPEKR
ncbi:hypothetical protein CEXT_448001 [Caerostris extrusa]|uniref:Uncharacterized protein n=1 Tax=Caerostris extrusa TaxID=172846 RepID=A0AAV4SN96_CAEEX|nr:hypothetical protein CEXT_448001 [Caerostris extrusa]